MAAGQPTALTPEIIREFERLLPTVMYLETVGDYLGVHRTTWRMWVRRGRKEANRLAKNSRAKPKQSEVLYLEFFYTHKRAIAKGELVDSGRLRKAGKENWTASAWRLERRFPERWGSDRAELRRLVKEIEELKKRVGTGPQLPEAGQQAQAPDGDSAAGS